MNDGGLLSSSICLWHACDSPGKEAQKAAKCGYHLAKVSIPGFSSNYPNMNTGSHIFKINCS